MTLRTHLRRWAIAVLALSLATALAACAQTKVGVSTAHPKVGSCHNLSTEEEMDATSDSRPAVACTAPHTLQTFAIGRVAGTLAAEPKRPGPERLRPLTDVSCPIPALRSFLGAGERDGVAPLAIHAFFPSAADWSAGAREIRCDIALPRPGGAPAVLRFDLASVMTRPQSAYLRTCYRQAPAASNQWSATGGQTTCDQPHSSQDINAWLSTPTATPSVAEIQQRCDPYVQEFLSTVAQPSGLSASGIAVKDANGTFTLRCTVGGGSASGNVSGSIAEK